MAQAARMSYESALSAAPRRAPQRQIRPGVRVIPGRRSQNPALRSLSPGAVSAFKAVIVLVALVAVVCGVRVMLSAATVENLQDIKSIESSIDSAQAKSQELEIQHSVLASSSRIEKKAAELGMSAPNKVTYMKVDLSDTVATNADGSISLAGTLANIQSAAASAGN